MRLLNSTLARFFLVVAVATALATPAMVYAGARDGRGGQDAGGAAGGAAESVGGAHAGNVDGLTDGQGDERIGDVRSNQTGAGPHTGAKGRGAGGEDVLHAVAVTGGGVTTGTHATTGGHTTVTGGTTAGGTATAGFHTTATPAAVGPSTTTGETSTVGTGEVAATTTETAVVTPPAAAAPATTPPLGARQIAPAAPALQQVALGTSQAKPRTLPFNGLSPAWAALITDGRWAGSLLSMLGLLLFVRGLRKPA